jgi:hypothetical protein
MCMSVNETILNDQEVTTYTAESMMDMPVEFICLSNCRRHNRLLRLASAGAGQNCYVPYFWLLANDVSCPAGSTQLIAPMSALMVRQPRAAQEGVPVMGFLDTHGVHAQCCNSQRPPNSKLARY